MPRRDCRLAIEDMLEAIDKIRRYTAGKTRDSFMTDEKTIDAVIRNITVIGEAARNIPEEIQKKNPDIPWTEMRGIRNVVVHDYFGISEGILWRTVDHDLPRLIPALRRLLADY